jgi:hypothetical protein
MITGAEWVESSEVLCLAVDAMDALVVLEQRRKAKRAEVCIRSRVQRNKKYGSKFTIQIYYPRLKKLRKTANNCRKQQIVKESISYLYCLIYRKLLNSKGISGKRF